MSHISFSDDERENCLPATLKHFIDANSVCSCADAPGEKRTIKILKSGNYNKHQKGSAETKTC